MNSKFAVGISACSSDTVNLDGKTPHFSYLMIKCWQSQRFPKEGRFYPLSKAYYEYLHISKISDVWADKIGIGEENYMEDMVSF